MYNKQISDLHNKVIEVSYPLIMEERKVLQKSSLGSVTSPGSLLINGSMLGWREVARPRPPSLNRAQSLGRTAF